MTTWIVILMLLATAGAADAVIRNSPTCQQADVAVTIGFAADGDTVTVPAGTCVWTGLLEFGKAITLQGAGIGSTIIIDSRVRQVGGFGGTILSVIIPNAGTLFRLTGFEFRGDGFQSIAFDGTVRIFGCSTHGDAKYRIDHNKLNNLDASANQIIITGGVFGVSDHNTFIGPAIISNFLSVQHDRFPVNGVCGVGPEGQAWGDTSWSEDLIPGSIQAHYLEDNTLTFNTLGGVNDALNGARYVVRFNTVFGNGFINGHGTDTAGRPRGYRWLEAYNNTFTYPAGFGAGSLAWARSGSGVFFNNAAIGDASIPGGFLNHMVQHHNSRDDVDVSLWGFCDGTKPWDQASDASGQPDFATGYRCIDQPGSGRSVAFGETNVPPNIKAQNTLDPIYVWNNTINGVVDNCAKFSCADDGHVVVNRDIYFGTARPGYTPFTYPHPLTLGGAIQPPGTPANLSVSWLDPREVRR